MRCRTALFAALVFAPRMLAAQPSVPAPAPNNANAQQEILTVITRMFDGMRAGDSAMVRSTLHPNARMVRPTLREGVLGSQVDGPDGWLKGIGTPHAEKWDERISNVKITVDGNFAHAWMDYEFWRGSTFSHCGIDSMHLLRMPDGWKVVDLADTARKDGCK